jgi:hypothetical protein
MLKFTKRSIAALAVTAGLVTGGAAVASPANAAATGPAPADKVITQINGKPLVDEQGNPAPVRTATGPSPLISSTSCTTSGGSFRTDVVRINYGTSPFTNNKCFQYAGTTTLGLGGVNHLYPGKWHGSVYYETRTACVARPFSPGPRLNFSKDTICVLSIEY